MRGLLIADVGGYTTIVLSPSNREPGPNVRWWQICFNLPLTIYGRFVVKDNFYQVATRTNPGNTGQGHERPGARKEHRRNQAIAARAAQGCQGPLRGDRRGGGQRGNRATNQPRRRALGQRVGSSGR